jgi:hypothetical protein
MFIKPFMPYADDAQDAKRRMRWASVCLFRQAEGLKEISRGLSDLASDTPGQLITGTTQQGSQRVFNFRAIKSVWHSSRVKCLFEANRWCRFAQPPANFYQPFRLRRFCVRNFLHHE